MIKGELGGQGGLGSSAAAPNPDRPPPHLRKKSLKADALLFSAAEARLAQGVGVFDFQRTPPPGLLRINTGYAFAAFLRPIAAGARGFEAGRKREPVMPGQRYLENSGLKGGHFVMRFSSRSKVSIGPLFITLLGASQCCTYDECYTWSACDLRCHWGILSADKPGFGPSQYRKSSGHETG